MKEEDLFKAWAHSKNYLLGRSADGNYLNPLTLCAWDAWQARAALAAPSPEAPAVDVLTTGAVEPVYLLRYKRTVIPPAEWEIVEKTGYDGAVDSYEKRILYAHPASEPKALTLLKEAADEDANGYALGRDWHERVRALLANPET